VRREVDGRTCETMTPAQRSAKGCRVSCSLRCQSERQQADDILWAIEVAALYESGKLPLVDMDAYEYAIASHVMRERADAKADAKATMDEVANALGAKAPKTDRARLR